MIVHRKTFLLILPVFLVLVLVGLAVTNNTKQPVTNDQLTTAGALSTWHSALLSHTFTPATWVAIGESITEGQGAFSRTDRWLDLTADHLQQSYPALGGPDNASYTPAIYRVEPPDSPWTDPWTSSSGKITPIYNLGDLGYRALKLASGSTITYRINGSSADIWYMSGKSLGSLQYKVDNLKPVSLNTAAKMTPLIVQRHSIELGPGLAHTITVTARLKSVYLSGLTNYTGNRSAGIEVYDSGYGGATPATFLQDSKNFKRSLSMVAPKLVTLEFGVNDYEQQTPLKEFNSRMQSLVKTVVALPSRPSIELIIPYQIYTKNQLTIPYKRYVEQLKEVAASYPNRLAVLDLSSAMPAATTSGQGYYTIDGIHPNRLGQEKLSELVYKSITH